MAKAKNRLDVDSFFNEVDQDQEVNALRGEVQALASKLDETSGREQELVAEIEQLRSQSLNNAEREQLQTQVDALREHLRQNQGTIQYPVVKIHPNPEQPRQTFMEEVRAMVASFRDEGQLDPIILFRDGMIFDGECRWRSATALGWETVEVVFTSRPKDSKTLRRQSYLTSLHRRNLNALDKAEALIGIVRDEIPSLRPEDIPRIVKRVLIRLERKKKCFGEDLHLKPIEQQKEILKEAGLTDEEAHLFAVFLGLQEHPTSLSRNIFPALNMTPDLKSAVRNSGLGCSQALILNSIDAGRLGIPLERALKMREQGIGKVLRESLSCADTQRWVNEQKLCCLSSPPAVRDKQVDRVLKAVQSVDLSGTKASPEQLQELKQTLEAVLKQLQENGNTE